MRKRITAGTIGRLLCLLPAAYFAVSVLYALLRFDEFAAAPHHFIRYVFVPGLLAALLAFVAFRLKETPRLHVGLNVCVVLFAMFAFEATQQVKVVQRISKSVAPSSMDVETVKATFDGLPPSRAPKSINARLASEPALADAVLGGIPNSNVFLCTDGSEIVSYRADRFGYRNPDTIYDEPIDIVVLGDSFTEGYCLPNGADFVSQLRNYAPQSASIALRGSGPLFELAMLRRVAPILKPSKIYVAFYEGNDWANLERELTMAWLREALDPAANPGDFSLSPAMADDVREITDSFWESDTATEKLFTRSPFIRNFFALTQTMNALGLIYPELPMEQPDFEAVLTGFKQTAAEIGAEVTLVYIPDRGRYQGVFKKGAAADYLRQEVLRAAKAVDLDVLDLAAMFEADDHPDRFYALNNGHFSKEGAAFAAAAVAEHAGAARTMQGVPLQVGTSARVRLGQANER